MIKWPLFLLTSLTLLSGCQKQTSPVLQEPAWTETSSIIAASSYVDGKELFTSAASEEEARRIAETYGIELVDFGYGVAVFHTEEDPYEVIRHGREMGWPALEVNQVVTLDKTDAQ